jgi:hypothetical protein
MELFISRGHNLDSGHWFDPADYDYDPDDMLKEVFEVTQTEEISDLRITDHDFTPFALRQHLSHKYLKEIVCVAESMDNAEDDRILAYAKLHGESYTWEGLVRDPAFVDNDLIGVYSEVGEFAEEWYGWKVPAGINSYVDWGQYEEDNYGSLRVEYDGLYYFFNE